MATQTVYLRSTNVSVSGSYANTYQECGRIGGPTGSAVSTWTFKWAMPECCSGTDDTIGLDCYMLPTSACNSSSAGVKFGDILNYGVNISVGFQNSSGTWYPNVRSYTISATDTRTSYAIKSYTVSGFDTSDQTYLVITVTRPRGTSGYYLVFDLYDSSNSPSASIVMTTETSAPSAAIESRSITSE